jgi:hypothetical protein
MSSSLAVTIHQALRALWKGTLDDHRTLILLRAALCVVVAGAITLVAADPVVRGIASMTQMREASDPHLRDQILAAWAARNLLFSARVYLWIDALVLTPALLLLLATFLHYYGNRLADDDTPPVFGRLAWSWMLAVPLLAFVASELGNVVDLRALHAGAPLASWLQLAVRWLHAGERVLYAIAIAECLWLFSSWFFLSPADTRGGASTAAAAADRARLRAAIADMLWRTKYALLVVVFYGALVLVMDQTRDALLRQIIDATGSGSEFGLVATALGLAITLAGLVLLARASWLWPRLILRLQSPDAPAEPPSGAEAFAKWWCRILGVAPYVFVAAMIANTFHDVPPGDEATRWFVMALGLTLLLGAVFLVRVSSRGSRGEARLGYYQRAGNREHARSDMGLLPLLVGWGAPLVFLLARGLALASAMPPLVLVVITSALATWAGVLGWVAYQSRRFAIPWLLLFVGWVGVAGFFDLTDAHRVRELVGTATALDPLSLVPTVVVLFVICGVVAAYWQRKTTSGAGRFISLLIAAFAILAAIHVHDHAPSPQPFTDTRASFDDAVSAWVAQLPDGAWKDPGQRTPANAYPVFLVSSEGGGIRAAYWTAVVLLRMQAAIPDFERRTFALSGTSGGAIGLAAYRACRQADPAPAKMHQCIEQFGKSDLWTQLLGGMFFEDSLAAVVPTWKCALPGCGVLGRAYWFEGALEQKVPAMANGLMGAARPAAHAPYLFLNVTRAETGERVIESDVRIGAPDFPGAPDLITSMQADVRLSTAAHNTSRFPFTNPVGALYGPGCTGSPSTGGGAGGAAGQALQQPAKSLCMRLQDGGYFDNSGALTVIDILRGLSRRLDAWRCAHVADGVAVPAGCAGRIAWIKPVVVEIRNNYTYAATLDGVPPVACAIPSDPPMDPSRALTAPPLKLYPSVITAAITTLATRDAHMRNFEGELERTVAAEWVALGIDPPQAQPAQCASGGVAAWIGDAPVHRFDLAKDGILYPSGWILSQRARDGIVAQAAVSVPCGERSPQRPPGLAATAC